LHETGIKLLNLMFKPGETVCVSHCKYGYHSIPLENAFKDKVTLVDVDESRQNQFVSSDELTLVALNPIKGFRRDENCTAFRSFLVEMDNYELKAQLEYIERLGLPYTAAVFSGNKSIHFVITLDQDLPNENIWRLFSEWILNIAALADDKTKNPSRSIRIPGGLRKEGRQRLIKLNGLVKMQDLVNFLQKYPDAKPKPPEKRPVDPNFNFDGIGEWCLDLLKQGLRSDKGRNQQWYGIAYEFALSGYSEDATIEILGKFFTPERDFKEREWLRTIRSAFERVYEEI
jgi:hypothetical protein